MRRLKGFILLFCMVLSIPATYLLFHTYRSLDQEERSELRYFANSLFDRMEAELSLMIQQEEARAVDDYTYKPMDKGADGKWNPPSRQLSQAPSSPFILGYFQNNPDGGFQSPLVSNMAQIPPQQAAVIRELEEVNRVFNRRRTDEKEGEVFRPATMKTTAVKEETVEIADKYFAFNERRSQKSSLGSKEKRLEQIPVAQALNVAPREQLERMSAPAPSTSVEGETDAMVGYGRAKKDLSQSSALDEQRQAEGDLSNGQLIDKKTFQVEVDPMQSVRIDGEHILIFRRIVIHGQIYRQGFVLLVRPFLQHLLKTHFEGQPMARFTKLQLAVEGMDMAKPVVQAGAVADGPRFLIHRTFPRPFSFVQATLACDRIPPSTGRRTLNIMVGVTALIFFPGLFAIYRSAGAVSELAERRALFVSSVTHELKTPLTNIRMYIEMLEQGIAQNPEREREYFRVLLSESGRLARLINNVLEFSKLEKKHRKADLQKGTLDDVITEVREVMQEKLRQEGFVLLVEKEEIPPFPYDREMMVQILINLMENSLKFSKNALERQITLSVHPQGEWVRIRLGDTGPGIPQAALKKIFDDFYRVDSEQVRNTQGTGIGLALVKKFAAAMGGSVSAANNPVVGCTITVSLPGSCKL